MMKNEKLRNIAIIAHRREKRRIRKSVYDSK